MSTATEELKNQVDEKLMELYGTSDPEKLAKVVFTLMTSDGERHYRTLAKIRASPLAMQSYVDLMLQAMAGTDRTPMNQDECEALLNDYLYSNIQSYWKGEIDGYKCAENLTTSFLSLSAGFAGWAGAVALCAGAGPCGLIFAGVAGGVLATGLTALGVRAIFQGMFGTDRDRALDKAYGVLGLKGRPAPECIRQSYLRLARENHPDKGGDKEEFIKINSAYELIRASILS